MISKHIIIKSGESDMEGVCLAGSPILRSVHSNMRNAGLFLVYLHSPGQAAQCRHPPHSGSSDTARRTDPWPPHRTHCDRSSSCPESSACTGDTSCPTGTKRTPTVTNPEESPWRSPRDPVDPTFSLSQTLSLLRYAMLSRSSSVISSTDRTSNWLLLTLWLLLFLCSDLSTCPVRQQATPDAQHACEINLAELVIQKQSNWPCLTRVCWQMWITHLYLE